MKGSGNCGIYVDKHAKCLTDARGLEFLNDECDEDLFNNSIDDNYFIEPHNPLFVET